MLLNLVIYTLITCCKGKLGKIYLEKIYTKTIKSNTENVNWFKKWKGNNWGINFNIINNNKALIKIKNYLCLFLLSYLYWDTKVIKKFFFNINIKGIKI